jgi:putative drug exporter of the RND superfamily
MSDHTRDAANEGAFQRWAVVTVRRRWLVLSVWFVALVALGVAWQLTPGAFVNNLAIPGSDSQQAVDLLRERFPDRAGDSAMIVLRADGGLMDPGVQQEVQAITAAAQEIPGVVAVVPPYAPGTQAISEDGRIGFVYVQFAEQANSVPSSSVDALYAIREAHNRDGFQVELGGQVVAASEQHPPGTSEALGVIAAVVILLVTFGSVIAMGVPLLTAFLGLIASLFIIGLMALTLDFSTETRAFTAMIGIGIGIDYALFIVTRYREGLASGLDTGASVIQAINTAGRSILFAGAVVVVSLAGLMLIGIPFVATLGLAAAVVVTLAVVVALTALPALLAVIGPRIDRWTIPAFHAVASDSSGGIWFRVAQLSQRRPWPLILAGFALLLLLSVPALDMRVGSADAGNNPTTLTSRHAYDLLTEGFGPGFNGPLAVVVDVTDQADLSTVERLSERILADPGVAMVSPPMPNPAQDTIVLNVVPTTAPQAAETQDLVHRLREDVLGPALDGSGASAYVGGPTAAFIDIADRITDRLPLFFAVVIGISMLLLAIIFRSLLVPVIAATMNLLSIGAAYGVLVAVFQWGWFSDVLGIDRTGPIESFLPMMLFAVLFGLSTDYMVFLVSRVHESWINTGDNRVAISHGSVATARVITAAAAIMIVVFLSFTLSDSRIVKEFGLGLATAIFVYATVIRLFLVPAIFGLLGKTVWYFPNWLDRRLPRVSVELPAPVSSPASEPLAPHLAD